MAFQGWMDRDRSWAKYKLKRHGDPIRVARCVESPDGSRPDKSGAASPSGERGGTSDVS